LFISLGLRGAIWLLWFRGGGLLGRIGVKGISSLWNEKYMRLLIEIRNIFNNKKEVN